MAGRVGVLADSVHELATEMREARRALPKVDVSKLGPNAVRVADRIAAALENFNEELAATNQKLTQLSRTPLLGMLGGGAEQEIQRLAAAANDLRAAAMEWRDLLGQR